MKERLKYWWRRMQEQRRIAKEVDPKKFRELADEMRELACVAEKVWPREHDHYRKVQSIRAEMEQLAELTTQPAFRRLPQEKRLALRKSLEDSREQLIKVVQTAPSPTQMIQ